MIFSRMEGGFTPFHNKNMSLFTELEKIKDDAFLVPLFTVIFLISPGILFIFLYMRDIFLAVDFFKLILVSIAITTPLILGNAALIAVLDEQKRNEKNSFFYSVALSAIMTGLILDLMMICFYSISRDAQLLFRIFLLAEAIFCINIVIKFNKNKKSSSER